MNATPNPLAEFRGCLMMAGISLLGFIGGIWAVIAPFATSWPFPGNGSWSHAVWATVIPGAVLIAASAVALMLSIGFAGRAAVRVRALRDEEPA